MRYMIQVMAMIAEFIFIAFIVGMAYAAFSQQSIFLLLLALVVLFIDYHEFGFLYSWRPSSINAFMANAEKIGL